MSLGKKIKQLRDSKGLTLRQLSEISGCSLGFLSQLERDLISPTVASLKKISTALGVNVIHFFDSSIDDERIVVRKNERNRMVNPKSKVTYELLRPQFSETELEALFMYLEPGAFSGKEPHTHIGEEFVIVLKGELEITVNNEVYLLKEGDSAIYKSNHPHSWKNPSSEQTEVLWVNNPPTF